MIIISDHIIDDLITLLPANPEEPVFILTDTATVETCLPLLKHPRLDKAHIITADAGDENKNLCSLTDVWHNFIDQGATRHSLLINLGGGMITDLGGFAAATFKRGMEFVNIPTTLLGAIDAASGGKTGINFLGLKNEIGVFAPAKAVLIDSRFFKTLDKANLLSGYAEMIKHALIDNEKTLTATLSFDFDAINYQKLLELVQINLDIKSKIVDQDPKELGIRKALNFGHTFGHAFEALSFKTSNHLLHGFAIMWGIVCELYLSHIQLGFPKKNLLEILHYTKDNYGAFPYSCKQYEAIFDMMKHDKKNEAQTINFTLLRHIGVIEIDQTATKEAIFEALDFVREN